MECAEKGLRIDQDCLGVDHPLYEQSLKIVQSLTQKSMSSTRKGKTFPQWVVGDGLPEREIGLHFIK
jgi:hypothetical protein